MRFKLFALSLVAAFCIFSGCTPKENTDRNTTENKPDARTQQISEYLLKQENTDYKLVKPDRGELQMIPCDLEYILSFFHNDYDFTKDNI